jgi:hypothetical protein
MVVDSHTIPAQRIPSAIDSAPVGASVNSSIDTRINYFPTQGDVSIAQFYFIATKYICI